MSLMFSFHIPLKNPASLIEMSFILVSSSKTQTVAGYQEMSSIFHNSDWWVIEVMDGFGAHLISEEANTIRFKNNILILKEEGDSSSTNQAYDKYVAKEDKHIQRKNLNFIRESRQRTYNITDKWGLLNCGLAAVQHTTMHLQLWVNSFIAVLHCPIATSLLNTNPFNLQEATDTRSSLDPCCGPYGT